MAIYIATFEAGKDPHNPQHVTRFDDMNDLYSCACAWTRYSVPIYPSWDIARILAVLEDHGPGFGARRHYRISARNAKRHPDAKKYCFDR